MQSSVAIGFSQAEDFREAAQQASVAVKNKLNSPQTDLVIVYISNHYAKREILDVIHAILKPVRLIGSSSPRIILSHGIFNRGLAILGINSKDMHFSIGTYALNADSNPHKTGSDFARKVNLDYKSPFSRRTALVYCDGISEQNSPFISGIQDFFGSGFPLIGTFSCDNLKLPRTFQFYQKQVFYKGAIGCLISSDAIIVSSAKHGFKPLGKPRTITQANNNIIQKIDNKPAIEIYQEFLHDEVRGFNESLIKSPASLYPLGIYLENLHQYLIRYPVDILDDGSIVCQADVPTQTEVHLMISNKDSSKEAAVAAAQEIKQALGGRQAQILIVFESMIRHRVLSHDAFLEIQTIKEILGYSTPIFGMSSFGELCSLGLGMEHTQTHLQNGSILLIAIG